MKNVFLDCGGHDGCSTAMFFDTFPDSQDFEVHIFEPNPRMYRYIVEHRCREFPMSRVRVHQAAVSDRDGTAPFFTSADQGKQWGSSLARTKTTGRLRLDDPTLVRTLDLSGWVRQNFVEDDFIVLKLNVEGAEYQILPAMMMDNTLSLIDGLFVNWHGDKLGLPRAIHDAVLNETSKVIPFRRWNAESYSTISGAA